MCTCFVPTFCSKHWQTVLSSLLLPATCNLPRRRANPQKQKQSMTNLMISIPTMTILMSSKYAALSNKPLECPIPLNTSTVRFLLMYACTMTARLITYRTYTRRCRRPKSPLPERRVLNSSRVHFSPARRCRMARNQANRDHRFYLPKFLGSASCIYCTHRRGWRGNTNMRRRQTSE
jgi:hypothetical protein